MPRNCQHIMLMKKYLPRHTQVCIFPLFHAWFAPRLSDVCSLFTHGSCLCTKARAYKSSKVRIYVQTCAHGLKFACPPGVSGSLTHMSASMHPSMHRHTCRDAYICSYTRYAHAWGYASSKYFVHVQITLRALPRPEMDLN
jgi:hypothetical protein